MPEPLTTIGGIAIGEAFSAERLFRQALGIDERPWARTIPGPNK